MPTFTDPLDPTVPLSATELISDVSDPSMGINELEARTAIRNTRGGIPGDQNIWVEVMERKGLTMVWNDQPGRTVTEVQDALRSLAVTLNEDDMTASFGTNWKRFRNFVRRIAVATEAEIAVATGVADTIDRYWNLDAREDSSPDPDANGEIAEQFPNTAAAAAGVHTMWNLLSTIGDNGKPLHDRTEAQVMYVIDATSMASNVAGTLTASDTDPLDHNLFDLLISPAVAAGWLDIDGNVI